MAASVDASCSSLSISVCRCKNSNASTTALGSGEMASPLSFMPRLLWIVNHRWPQLSVSHSLQRRRVLAIAFLTLRAACCGLSAPSAPSAIALIENCGAQHCLRALRQVSSAWRFPGLCLSLHLVSSIYSIRRASELHEVPVEWPASEGQATVAALRPRRHRPPRRWSF